MKTTSTTEQQLREEKVPTPATLEELVEYIVSLKDLKHDYRTCVYAMSMSATATYNYMAFALGASGFQASCADLDILRRTRRIEGPMKIVTAESMLYHDDDDGDAKEWNESVSLYLCHKAREVLAKGGRFHPRTFSRLSNHATGIDWTDALLEQWNKSYPDEAHESVDAALKHSQELSGVFRQRRFVMDELQDPLPEFVEDNAALILEHGIKEVNFFRDDVSKYTEAKNDGSYRYDFPVGITFTRKIGDLEVRYNIDTEVGGFQAHGPLNINITMLEELKSKAQPAVATFLTDYIERAKVAMAKFPKDS